MKKLISIDLDGTLLNLEKNVSNRNLNTLLKCKELGHEIVFASARPRRAIVEVLPPELLDNILICFNGAEIYHGNKVLHRTVINKEDAKNFVKQFSKKYKDNYIGFETDLALYSNSDCSKYFGEIEHNIVDFNSFEFHDTAKLLIGTDEISNEDEIKEIIPGDCRIIFTDNGILGQVINKNVSKLSGIKRIAEMKNINMEDVIAFGDDFNDYEIIKECGMGVAMGNAIKELKDVAKSITLSNNEDGVAYFLETHLNIK